MNRYGLVALTAAAFAALTIGIDTAGSQDDESAASSSTIDALADSRTQPLLDSGRKIFRFDTFGDQAFWGDTLRLHRAIAGSRNGGVGPGLAPSRPWRSASRWTSTRCRLSCKRNISMTAWTSQPGKNACVAQARCGRRGAGIFRQWPV